MGMYGGLKSGMNRDALDVKNGRLRKTPVGCHLEPSLAGYVNLKSHINFELYFSFCRLKGLYFCKHFLKSGIRKKD